MTATEAKHVKTLANPKYYINRELSWLAFNKRVLELAQRVALPLMERLKFLAIFSSNLDEFFMIRVAGLSQQIDAGIRKKGMAGRTPLQQIKEISAQTHQLVSAHGDLVNELLISLRNHGLSVLRRSEWNTQQRAYVNEYFRREVWPVLTPLAVESLNPCPLLPNLQMNVAITVKPNEEIVDQNRLLVIPVPPIFPRFARLPVADGTCLVTVEDVIADNAEYIVPGSSVQSVDFFRITRDADVQIKEDEASDLLNVMEAAVVERRRRSAVRLEISARSSSLLQTWLRNEYDLKHMQIYRIDSLLNAKDLWGVVAQPGHDDIRFSDWSPQTPLDLFGYDSIWEAISEKDILMYHPYESFEPVVNLLQEAAADPEVLAIKQTLYRTSSDSPIISALQEAAENGKEVTVLVELKARFDEARNVQWARRLEDAGCHVIYGVVGLKTHAKALLIIRREEGRIRRYVHLATGNYHDKTARLYSDIGLFSCDPQLATDVGAFFNLLTGLSEAVGWSRIVIAPTSMKKRFIELIDRESKASSAGNPGLIMAKVNSLEDKEICQALYRASSRGVRVLLNVRGICCLKPGIRKVSENIRVVSLLGRYLEHARVFYFANGGREEVYMSSADWMNRNLEKRFELLFPISDLMHKMRCRKILETCFADNTHAWELKSDGTYEPVTQGRKKIQAQQVFHEEVLLGQQREIQRTQRFKPVRQEQK